MNHRFQLVLQFPFIATQDFESLIQLEEALIEELGADALVDGHDAGSREMNIFIHTDNPQNTFARILSLHQADNLFRNLNAAFRPLEPERADFVVLWPKNGLTTFSII